MQAERYAGGAHDRLVAAYGEGPLAGRLAAAAEAAHAGYAETARYLRTDYAPRASASDAVGAERYAVAARLCLGADINPVEAYVWGWEELHRIEAELAHEAGRVHPGASVDEATALLGQTQYVVAAPPIRQPPRRGPRDRPGDRPHALPGPGRPPSTGVPSTRMSHQGLYPSPDPGPASSQRPSLHLSRGSHPIFRRMALDHPDDHPDDPSGSVRSHLDRPGTQPEQARSVWIRLLRRRASGYGSGTTEFVEPGDVAAGLQVVAFPDFPGVA